jgi:hypothetical protein
MSLQKQPSRPHLGDDPRERTQAEGPDEEAGHGLEQPAPEAPEQEDTALRCKKDKGGIVH